MTVETIEEQLVAVRRWTLPRWLTWVRWGLEGVVTLLTLLGFLVFDRVRLFQEFTTKFIDEDQGIEWNAACRKPRGHFHEPCFFGQAYNSNIEGYLAAPLVAIGVPYLYAVPLVTVLLSVLPFVLMAWVAWRRRQPIVAAISLMLPAILSTRYGIITGMPRGFVTGDAFAMIPAFLFLPPARNKLYVPAERPRRDGVPLWRRALAWVGRLFVPPPVELRRTFPKSRYFLAAFFAVVAMMFNPNCAILLAGVAVYGFLTTWREWRFWLFTILGLTLASPYKWLVDKFYNVWQPDYHLYQNYPRKEFDWSWAHFREYVRSLADLGFHDVVPDTVYKFSQTTLHAWRLHHPQWVTLWMGRNPAPMALMVAFGVAILLLILRLRIAALLGALAAVALVFLSLAYSRLQDGRTGASFPYSRMFLAVPVTWVWILLLINSPRLKTPNWERWRWLAWWRWTTHFTRRWIMPTVAIAVMFLCVWCAGHVVVEKNKTLADDIADINDDAQVARPVTMEENVHIAKAIQAVADKEHITFVLISGYDGRKWDYTLPELTTCETLFPSYERRTWRLVEECYPRYDKIMVLGNIPFRRSAHFPTHTVVSRDPPIAVFPLNGQSVATFCEEMGMPYRAPFHWPDIPGQPKRPPVTDDRD